MPLRFLRDRDGSYFIAPLMFQEGRIISMSARFKAGGCIHGKLPHSIGSGVATDNTSAPSTGKSINSLHWSSICRSDLLNG